MQKSEIIELLEQRIKEAEYIILNHLWFEDLCNVKGVNYIPDGDGWKFIYEV